MSVDTSAMGVLVAELMDTIADEYGEDVRVGTVAVVVEIDGDEWTQVRQRTVATRDASDDEPDET